ncbi:MAG: alanyl-tRNA editing protein [Trueperaceae bacterium]
MRLERYDSYATEFRAEVRRVRANERGTWLLLTRSAFYPTAGGQPHDTGVLSVAGAALRVTDVQADEHGVWHLVEGPLPDEVAAMEAAGEAAEVPAGAAVHGVIDWPRRYRHMQRHTAQHLLSQALVRTNPDYGTRSVSMRGADCTIDFGGEVDEASLAAVEAEANRAARQALSVMCFEVDDARLGEYRLRRPAQVRGMVRLVAIGDYDLVACGGTHLRNSAEALPLKIVGLERVKGGTNRLTFRAGEEAQADYGAKHVVANRLGVALSAPAEELVERVERLQADLAELGRQLAATRLAQAAAVAQRLSAEAQGGVVSAYLAGDEADLFAELVDVLQREPGLVSLLAAPEASGNRVRFAFLAGPGAATDVRPALSSALAALGGRGGGRPDRAQGAAQADAEQARTALSTAAAQLRK